MCTCNYRTPTPGQGLFTFAQNYVLVRLLRRMRNVRKALAVHNRGAARKHSRGRWSRRCLPTEVAMESADSVSRCSWLAHRNVSEKPDYVRYRTKSCKIRFGAQYCTSPGFAVDRDTGSLHLRSCRSIEGILPSWSKPAFRGAAVRDSQPEPPCQARRSAGPGHSTHRISS
jgi:hypothetical protein